MCGGKISKKSSIEQQNQFIAFTRTFFRNCRFDPFQNLYIHVYIYNMRLISFFS